MFEYNKVTFRAVEESDLHSLWFMRKDEEINSNLFTVFPISEVSQKKWLDGMLANQTNKVLMVDFDMKSRNEPLGVVTTIGCARLANIDFLNQNIEIGADIAGGHRGKGYGKHLYHALCSYCFDQLNMHRIYLYVLKENKVAIKVYKSVGFEVEATLKDYKFKNGKFQDVYLMTKFKDEE